MNRISADIVADSLNKYGQRLTTFVLLFPRIVLAEFNTHRMLSRNSASSRAIPFKKMIEKVKKEPFIPIAWQKEHSGMQGTEYFEEQSTEARLLKDLWLEARDVAVSKAEAMSSWGVTKQVVNRLLEPFLYHTCICTASEWENFFSLRADGAAEIHIQDLAFKMLEAYNASEPKHLKAGEWHIPFGDTIDELKLHRACLSFREPSIRTNDLVNFDWEKIAREAKKDTEEWKVKIATARCARVSYLNFEGKDDYDTDIKLHDRLINSGHCSPAEHCAQAMDEEQINSESFNYDDGDNGTWGWSGNFRGFIQYRKTLVGENRKDNRVIFKTI